jgi:ribosome-binding protein aMBF1 (putative translation factor)
LGVHTHHQPAFSSRWSTGTLSKSTRHVSRDLRKAAGSKKAVRDIDAQIGQRIREARQAQGMAQEVLANGLGISFQQVQKYENGSNRISAARLYDIAQLFGMAITFFYEGAEPFARSVNRRNARAASRGS